MPAADARKPARIILLSFPKLDMTPRSLIDRTGKTHGMTLRIKPPSKANIIIAAKVNSLFWEKRDETFIFNGLYLG